MVEEYKNHLNVMTPKNMKRLLLPLLAALAFPTSVNANFYDEQVFKRRWPVFIENYNNAAKFRDLNPPDEIMMCESYVKANNELMNNFVIFQRYRPDVDFFEVRSTLKNTVKLCGEKHSIY